MWRKEQWTDDRRNKIVNAVTECCSVAFPSLRNNTTQHFKCTGALVLVCWHAMEWLKAAVQCGQFPSLPGPNMGCSNTFRPNKATSSKILVTCTFECRASRHFAIYLHAILHMKRSTPFYSRCRCCCNGGSPFGAKNYGHNSSFQGCPMDKQQTIRAPAQIYKFCN